MNLRPAILAMTVYLPSIAAAPALADQQPAVLLAARAVAPDIGGLPRVAGKDAASTRINKTLDRTEARLRKDLAECRVDNPGGGKGDSPVSADTVVTMTGPAYLSFLLTEEIDCGAHPDTSSLALVFDLRTGALVDWFHLLPKALTQRTAAERADAPASSGTVSSTSLARLYLDASPDMDKECRVVFKEEAPASFIFWPDPAHDGLAMQPTNLPHVEAACADAVTIPVATLRSLAVDPGLVDAIAAAHDQGWFTKSKP